MTATSRDQAVMSPNQEWRHINQDTLKLADPPENYNINPIVNSTGIEILNNQCTSLKSKMKWSFVSTAVFGLSAIALAGVGCFAFTTICWPLLIVAAALLVPFFISIGCEVYYGEKLGVKKQEQHVLVSAFSREVADSQQHQANRIAKVNADQDFTKGVKDAVVHITSIDTEYTDQTVEQAIDNDINRDDVNVVVTTEGKTINIAFTPSEGLSKFLHLHDRIYLPDPYNQR